MRQGVNWSIFGGDGAAPVPKDEPKDEHKSEETRLGEALHRNAQRKCSGMSMMNHITAWNSLAGLKGAHRAKLESMGYSASTFGMIIDRKPTIIDLRHL